jgi:hypothetical protein
MKDAAAVAFFVLILFAHSDSAVAFESQAREAKAPTAKASTGEERAGRKYIVWPLVFVEETPSWRQFSFVPIYVTRETADDAEKRVQILWPLFLYRRFELDVKVHLFPLVSYWRDVYLYEDAEERDFDYMVLPFFFGGTSSEGESYFAFFPLFGTLRDYFGRDEIRFLLFPLYLDYSKNSFYQRNFLWPVLSFSSGGGYDGFRFWPFYGYIAKEGEYHNKFILWPFYHSQQFDLDKEQTGRRRLVLPFYAMEESQRRSYRAVLWPFFAHEHNFSQNYERYSVPWPFVIVTRGDTYETRLWPIYGRKRTSESERNFILWPLWRQNEFVLDHGVKRNETILMPFLFRSRIIDSESIREEKVRFWPLWRSQRFEDGSSEFRMFSFLWFDDERGFESHYAPLWTIYERSSSPDDTRHVRMLWGLVRHDRTSEGARTHVPLLFTRTRDIGRDVEETEILKGLIAIRNEAGVRNLRVLYGIRVPLGR